VLPQEECLNILTEFLLRYGYNKVNGIPIDAIRKLARIVLTENVFIYEKKFYRQILGGAMGSTFTLTLANIFMWKWETKLVRQQEASNEILWTVGFFIVEDTCHLFDAHIILFLDILMISSLLQINHWTQSTVC
jgi:hypothetical protein